MPAVHKQERAQTHRHRNRGVCQSMPLERLRIRDQSLSTATLTNVAVSIVTATAQRRAMPFRLKNSALWDLQLRRLHRQRVVYPTLFPDGDSAEPLPLLTAGLIQHVGDRRGFFQWRNIEFCCRRGGSTRFNLVSMRPTKLHDQNFPTDRLPATRCGHLRRICL